MNKMVHMLIFGYFSRSSLLFGFEVNSIRLRESDLDNRIQIVRVKIVSSVETAIKIAVPKGSILEPIFFLIYINDLPLSIGIADATLFFDDSCYKAFELSF